MGYVHNEHFFIMARNQEKNSVVKGIFLIGGWGFRSRQILRRR